MDLLVDHLQNIVPLSILELAWAVALSAAQQEVTTVATLKIEGTHRESEGVPTLPVPESVRKEGGQNWNFVLGWGFQKWTWRDGPKMESFSTLVA